MTDSCTIRRLGVVVAVIVNTESELRTMRQGLPSWLVKVLPDATPPVLVAVDKETREGRVLNSGDYVPDLAIVNGRQDLAFTTMRFLWREYQIFLNTAKTYRECPDFMHAYQYVDTHPVFWTLYESGNLFHWKTGGLNPILYPSFYKGSHVWNLEVGPHTDDYTMLRDDPSLCSYRRKSVEDCYLDVATRLNNLYKDDGTLRDPTVVEVSR